MLGNRFSPSIESSLPILAVFKFYCTSHGLRSVHILLWFGADDFAELADASQMTDEYRFFFQRHRLILC